MAAFRNSTLVVTCSAVFLLFITMTSLPATEAAAVKEYIVETLVFVDGATNDTWSAKAGKIPGKGDLPTEILSTMNEINEIYKTMYQDYGFKVTIKVKEIVYIKLIIVASINGNVAAENAWEQLHQYLAIRPEYKADLFLLFTGYNLDMVLPGDLKGIAKLKVVCTDHSIAVTQFRGTFTNSIVAAHEIAHVLGSNHEGVGDNNCSPSDQYIMTAGPLLTKNRYRFSQCSWQTIRSVFQSYTATCLNDGDTDDDNTEVPRFGELMTPDDLCRRHFGRDAYLSRTAYGGYYGDNVCLQLSCINKKKETVKIPSPDGLYCGKNKQCIKGDCVHTSAGKSSVPDSCPFGDQPVLEGTGPRGCGMVSESECSKWSVECCQTCNKALNPELGRSADDACRKLEGAYSSLSRWSYKTQENYADMCSNLYCLKSPSIGFKTNKYTAPDGMACAKNKRCRNGNCETVTDGNPNIDNDCPFGDQPWVAGKYKKSCERLIFTNGCNAWKPMCCKTCSR